MLFTINDVIQYDKDLSAGIIKPLHAMFFKEAGHTKFESLFRPIGMAKDIRPLLNWMSEVKKPENHDDSGQCTLLNTPDERQMYLHWERICTDIYQGLNIWCSHCNTVLRREGFNVYAYHILQEEAEIDPKILSEFECVQTTLLFNGDAESKWQDIRISIPYMADILEWVDFIEAHVGGNRSHDGLRYLSNFKDRYDRLSELLLNRFGTWAHNFIRLESLNIEEKLTVLEALEKDTPQYYKQKIDQVILEKGIPKDLVDLIQTYASRKFVAPFWKYGRELNSVKERVVELQKGS